MSKSRFPGRSGRVLSEVPPRLGHTRRGFLKGSGLVLTSVAAASVARRVSALDRAELFNGLSATPPDGFRPLQLPGRVVKVTKGASFEALMQPNQLWPKKEVARQMLESALTELTGASNLTTALGRFIHPKDRVALKVNGISGQTGHSMAFNFELIEPVVTSLLELGVAAEAITVFEQFPNFLKGTRVGVSGNVLPEGVRAEYHGNRDATMAPLPVFNGIKTRFVRQVTDATAIIDMTMMKDHSICGFTGALKNMTHGQIVNPQDHHAHRCDPQIPLLYGLPILRSRVRLHLVDAFKIIYDKGPLDKDPRCRIPHGAVYASTDPVALDRVGLRVIEDARKTHGLPALADVRRDPSYLDTATELGLGIGDWNHIQLRSVSLN